MGGGATRTNPTQSDAARPHHNTMVHKTAVRPLPQLPAEVQFCSLCCDVCLLLGVGVNASPVLRAHVSTLLVERGGVMLAPEHVEQLLEGHLRAADHMSGAEYHAAVLAQQSTSV